MRSSPSPDMRRRPAPGVGEFLLARPGLGPLGLPCLVVHAAERHDLSSGWRPLPYRATPATRRTAVALYLGGGAWAPAILTPAELARLDEGLAAWPEWRDALLGAEVLVREAAALVLRRTTGLGCRVPRALAAAHAKNHTDGASVIYPTGV